MLLSEEEISQISLSAVTVKDATEDVRAIEAAILAKLASAELPEPLMKTFRLGPMFTTEQMGSRFAQGFAAGAAAQLAEKPSAFQLRDEEASEHYGREIYVLYSVFDFKDGANIGNIEKVLTPLYTRRQANEATAGR